MELHPRVIQWTITGVLMVVVFTTLTEYRWLANFSSIIAGALCLFFRHEPWMGARTGVRPTLSMLMGAVLMISGIAGVINTLADNDLL